MSFFVAPSNYSDLPPEERRTIVPIYVSAVDARGNVIPQGWFDRGVIPAANTLRHLADFHLGDTWLASELTERVVHKLARKHGETLGQKPWCRVIVAAQWEARTIKAGDQWLRKHQHSRVPLDDWLRKDDYFHVTLDSLYRKMSRETLKRAAANEDQQICRIMLDGVDAQLAGKERYQKAYRLLRAGYSWTDIQKEFGLPDRKKVLAFKKGFYRYAALVH